MTAAPAIPDSLRHALADTRRVEQELDRLDAESSLRNFVRVLWPVLEPGRKLVSGWAMDAICEHLEAVHRGEVRKLLVNVPPGAMKSMLTAVFLPAWEWGPRNRPDLRYVCASYAEALSVRDNRRCRNLIQSRAYREMWGDRFDLTSDQNAKVRFDTSAAGFKIATSVGGIGTGERGDRFIIDDPHNVREAESEARREGALQWFTEVVPTRINDPERSAIIVIMQRVHERDVAGLILAQELGYEHLMLPMEFEPSRRCTTSIGFEDPRTEDGELLWPERFSREYLEEDLKPSLRAWGGTYAEASQLQQRPAPRGGGLFQRKDFAYVDESPALARVVRGYDLAATDSRRAAYTAGVKLGMAKDGRVIVLDVQRGQWGPHRVREEILATAKADGYAVQVSLPQDPGQAGKSQKSELAALLHGYDVHFSPETGSKAQRASALAAQAEAGNVALVRGSWNDAFVNELCAFPMGEYADQVDAASRAYARLLGAKRQRVGGKARAISG